MKNHQSGNFQNQGYYKSFQPSLINRQWLMDDMEILQLLSKADRQLGRLDMYSEYIPNIEMYISMHVIKEATQSSKIEGTQTKIEEAFLEKEDIVLEKRDDWEEVQNYIQAMNTAIKLLEQLPFSNRLIKETHKILLQGVRGQHKQPGHFRTSQNWIGGATINDAIFIPPIYASLPELMSDLEKFANNQENYLPDLIKIALIHYQFETIHPFLDGNGRVGRLLITLYLVDKSILKKPVLYLSDFFERNRQLYYDNLMNVRTKNDLKQWLKFFLVGVIETSQNGILTFDAVLKLKKDIEEKIQNANSRNKHLLNIMEFLYQKPVINASKIVEITNVSQPTAYKILDEMVNMEILNEITGGKRGKVYVFDAYVKLFS
ncbi:Fic family protein [Paucihalobacter ruber]|uniref:Fic family protein n=1 Tax=Paucihalobacter ruber TaxID=2567861 RepID=A0A506PMY1_9FLAO|nr:Fic family protein [Paucihalobacter ruber]TPV35091.1 Fic family protein [Paucihalobacter ruber]